MRSARPKPLHLLCGRAMLLLRPRLAGRAATSTGPSWSSATAPSGSPRSSRTDGPTCSSTSSSSTSSGAPATPSASASPPSPTTTSTTTTATSSSCPGDTPLLRPATIAALVDAPPASPAPACTVLTARRRRPHRLRPRRAGQGRPRRAHRRAARRHRRGAGDRRDQHVDLLLPPQRARPGPAPAQPRERPGRVLPDRRRRGAARRRLPRRPRRRRRRRRDRRASTTACSWPRPRPSCAGAPTTRWLRARRHHGRPRAAPTSTPPSQLGADVTLFPGTILQGAHGRRRAAPRSAPTPASSTAWSAPDAVVEQTVGRDAEIGADADVGPVRRARARARRSLRGTATGPFYTAAARRR